MPNLSNVMQSTGHQMPSIKCSHTRHAMLPHASIFAILHHADGTVIIYRNRDNYMMGRFDIVYQGYIEYICCI